MTIRTIGLMLAALACCVPGGGNQALGQSRATGLEHRDTAEPARRHRRAPRMKRNRAGGQKVHSAPKKTQATPPAMPAPQLKPVGGTAPEAQPPISVPESAPARAPSPGTIPIPAPAPSKPLEAATPDAQPPAPAPGGEPAQSSDPPAAAVPIPAPKPAPEASSPNPGSEKPATLPPPAPAASLPQAESACRNQLKALGAAFTEQPPESDPSGCSIPHPVLLSRLSATIALEPAALMNCSMAEAATRFTQSVIAPLAREHVGQELVSVGQASAYVCRPRHGTAKLSEHAFGNALDMGRFVFAGGAAIEVGPVPGKSGEAFLGAVRKAACGPFKTVLGPGSDADHARHLHFDLQQRRGGGDFCQ